MKFAIFAHFGGYSSICQDFQGNTISTTVTFLSSFFLRSVYFLPIFFFNSIFFETCIQIYITRIVIQIYCKYLIIIWNSIKFYVEWIFMQRRRIFDIRFVLFEMGAEYGWRGAFVNWQCAAQPCLRTRPGWTARLFSIPFCNIGNIDKK